MNGPAAFVSELVGAVNSHDLEAIVRLFAADYVNETPCHPGRGFEGSDQVRRNWGTILAAVPDIKAEVTRLAVDGDAVWTEWEMHGTRRDGAAHLMRGVIIFGVSAERATWARFYLEIVDAGSGGVDAAVAQAVGSDTVAR
jgi:ketosteroid isomerase-like protein